MSGRVIFVSHEWLGFEHPDPSGEQFATLQCILKRLMDGRIAKVESHWIEQVGLKHKEAVTAAEWKATLPHMFVWFDYWSVPQPGAIHLYKDEEDNEGEEDSEQQQEEEKEHEKRDDVSVASQISQRISTISSCRSDHRFARSTSLKHAQVVKDLQQAVASIPEYIGCSDLMLVLVPVCRHYDRDVVCNYPTWRSRGWCRVELQAALLKRGSIKVMICNGAEATPFFLHPTDAWQLAAGEGAYTCCCLGHKINGETVECDKIRICRVLEDMLDSKAEHLTSTGDLSSMRWLRCMQHHVLRGLPSMEKGRVTLLRPPVSYAKDPTQKSPSNALALLQQRLSWTVADDSLVASTGRSLWLYAALADDDDAMRDLLHCSSRSGLESEVLHPNVSFGEMPFTPLMAAMAVARFAVVELVLQAGATPYQCVAKTSAYKGVDALMFAAMFGHANNVKAWLARFPTWDLGRRETTAGLDVLMIAALSGPGGNSTLATVRALLEAKANPLAENEIGTNTLTAACDSDSSSPDVVRELLAAGVRVNDQQQSHTYKWKALLLAGRIATSLGTRSLLLQGLSQAEGCTPLFAAARGGKVAEIEELLWARADTTLRNRKGQTALDVARESYGTALASDVVHILTGF